MRLSNCVFLRLAVRRAARPLALAASLCLAGCAGDQAYREGSWLGGGGRIAMEEDGKPAQIPPMRRPQPAQDDPREPYSRNYGPPIERSPSVPPQIPDDLPPAFRRQLAVALAQ